VGRREWVRLSREVLQSASAPLTPKVRVLAAVLHAGPMALAARHTAAALWGFPGFDIEPVHVLVPLKPNPRPTTLAITHTTRDLLPTHRAERRGIPLTTPARTLFDLAVTEHPKRVERALDTALGLRLIDRRILHRTLDELADRGRTGIVLMRDLIEERDGHDAAAESRLEVRVATVLAAAGLPPMRRQVNVGGDTWVGRVDYLDAELPVILEVQSDRFHGSLSDRRRDAARRQALVDAGFLVGEASEDQVWHHPGEVVELVRQLRREARRRLLTRDRPAPGAPTGVRTA
jgi:very-short-patch-repair endonuclease